MSPTAAKALRRIPKKTGRVILITMESIAADPFGNFPNAKRFAADDRFRLRVGHWRALYRVDRVQQAVYLEDVLKREEA